MLSSMHLNILKSLFFKILKNKIAGTEVIPKQTPKSPHFLSLQPVLFKENQMKPEHKNKLRDT